MRSALRCCAAARGVGGLACPGAPHQVSVRLWLGLHDAAAAPVLYCVSGWPPHQTFALWLRMLVGQGACKHTCGAPLDSSLLCTLVVCVQAGAASKAPAAAAKNGIARYFSGGSTAAPQQPRQAPQEEDAIQPPAKRQKSPQHGECRVGNLMPSVAACGRASSAATEQGGGGGWHSGSAAASAAGWDFGVPQLLLPGPRRKAAVEAGAFGVGESCAAQQPGSTSFDRSLLGGAAAAQTGAGAAAPPRHLGLWSQLDADIGSGGWRGAAAEVLGAGGRVLAGDSFLQQQQPQPSLSIPLSTGCLGSDASLGTASVPASGSSMLADSRSLASLPLSSAGGSNPLAFASCPQGGSLWGDGSLCSSMGPGSQPGSSWPGSGSLPGGSEGGNGRAMSALHSLVREACPRLDFDCQQGQAADMLVGSVLPMPAMELHWIDRCTAPVMALCMHRNACIAHSLCRLFLLTRRAGQVAVPKAACPQAAAACGWRTAASSSAWRLASAVVEATACFSSCRQPMTSWPS